MNTPHDMSQPPDLRQKHGTGAARLQRPDYVSLLPPCNNACPAGENIQAWLAHAQAGHHREAWEQILQDNPLPAVHGRICYHPCETSCNRAQLDGTVSIHALERFLGDKALAEGWTPALPDTRSGKKVLVIGAGPSGLSCAHHLSLLGHEVEIRDAGPVAGGMMHFGIPAYRLPRDILDGEVDRIRRQGVTITLNHKVEDLAREKEQGAFDAAFVAVGAHLSKRIEVPGRDTSTIYDAVGFLKDVESGTPPKIGRRVAIYGGGNTAMDAARTAKRLGHEPMIIYRRDRAHMPAHDFEADEALEEGVRIHWLRTIKSAGPEGMQVEVMEINPETGRPEPTGEVETIEADDLILALGQDTDTAFLSTIEGVAFAKDGSVLVDSTMMTGAPGVFAGGDMVPSDRTATIGVGHGKKAARSIDAWLRSETVGHTPKNEIASFEKLHLWFYTDVAQRPQSSLDLARRKTSFQEVIGDLSEAEALHEAERCLSCGNCFECDGCYGACPEDAISKLGPGQGYKVNFELCTGCAVCVEQCPCHAMEMIPEPSAA